MTDEAAVLASDLAVQLPATDMRELSRAAAAGREGLIGLRTRGAAPVLRTACDRCLAALSSCSPDYLAGTLAGAAALAEQQERASSIEVVWTGPHSQQRTNRLTFAVVIDLIARSRRDVVLVSYATQTQPEVAAALEAAVDRGVQVTLLVERPADNPSYTARDVSFPTLPADRLHWPIALRPEGAALHAKILVVDTSLALVGSANLTSRALERNLECGVLIRGGRAPALIRAHLQALLALGVLRRTAAPADA